MTYVRLRVGSEQYALPVDAVREIAPIGQLMPMPGAPPHLLGVRNMRGEILPVIELAAVAGVGKGGPSSVVAVVEDAGRRAGLAVDEVLEVGSLPARSEESASPLLRGEILTDGQLVGLLDPDTVLTAAAWRHGG